MAPDTASPKTDPPGMTLHWSGRMSLTRRILAVNILPVVLLAGSLFYLDVIRDRLIAERLSQSADQVRLLATVFARVPQDDYPAEARRLGATTGARVRVVAADGCILADSWDGHRPNIALRDPDEEGWQRRFAAALDDAVDAIVRARPVPRFPGFGPPIPNGQKIWLTDERTHIVSSAAPIPDRRNLRIVVDKNVRDIRRLARADRGQLGIIVGMAALASILLSLFLARTIVRPLRFLAMAAERVRLGRAREVVVPRLPFRSDEIGHLARSLSDMTETLRARIDATEAFAADVSHELKNPLASLSSAVEGMERVKDEGLRQQLMQVAADDVRRLDRLITDISEASRLDAQLTRTRFEAVDVGAVIEGLLHEREARSANGSVRIAFARPQRGSTRVMGDAGGLARVFGNLIDNAVSFSPQGGVVRISATRSDDEVIATVEDDGPGVPPDAREAIFERFHSLRPDGEAFGKHSGLGLAISRTIIAGHGGTISVRDRADAQRGAVFLVTLPAAQA
ncbi:MAG: ATP-binding protein [Chakrabartia godavariana]